MSTLSPVERGQLLRSLRTAVGLTQKQVGDHFGIDKAAISAWEKGGGIDRTRLTDLDALYQANGAVLEAFGIPIRLLLDKGDPTLAEVEHGQQSIVNILRSLEDLRRALAAHPDDEELARIAQQAVDDMTPHVAEVMRAIADLEEMLGISPPGGSDLRRRVGELEQMVEQLQVRVLQQDVDERNERPPGATPTADSGA